MGKSSLAMAPDRLEYSVAIDPYASADSAHDLGWSRAKNRAPFSNGILAIS